MPYLGVGDGMAILGPCLVAATGILKWKKNGNVSEKLCDERSGDIRNGVLRIEAVQEKMFDELKEIRREMK
jgi:hypothetical protein